jgi:hypothetical protein
MRWEILLLVMIVGTSGCATRDEGYGTSAQPSAATADGSAPQKPATAIVTPATGNRGRITSVNLTSRHVVVSYPIGIPLPLVEQRLFVYRAGLKVAELKVSKERIDVNLIADIASGECRTGDEVRTE